MTFYWESHVLSWQKINNKFWFLKLSLFSWLASFLYIYFLLYLYKTKSQQGLRFCSLRKHWVKRMSWRRQEYIRAILCQGPPEIVNWNFLTLKQFFTNYFLRPWNFYSKNFFWIIFINCGFFVCLQKNLSIFCYGHDSVKCHWEFVEFGGKLKQYIRIGSWSLLLPRNNT